MGNRIRCFIAIRLPESVLRVMGKAQEAFQQYDFDIRWVRLKGIHLTLKFLGDIDEKDSETVGVAMAKACTGVSTFTLKGQGIGVFPNLKRPRVLWAGISGDIPVLLELQKRLEDELDAIGFPREKRRFKGHLTLGRIKSRLPKASFEKALRASGNIDTAPFEVRSLVLYKSTLRPQGAIYDPLVEATLGT